MLLATRESFQSLARLIMEVVEVNRGPSEYWLIRCGHLIEKLLYLLLVPVTSGDDNA